MFVLFFLMYFKKPRIYIFRFKTKWSDWTSHPLTKLSPLSISSNSSLLLLSRDSTKPLFQASSSSNNLNKIATCSNHPPSKGHFHILATHPWPRGSGLSPMPDPLQPRFPAGVTAFLPCLLSPPWLEISGSDLSCCIAFLIDCQWSNHLIDGYQCGWMVDWLAWLDNCQLNACYWKCITCSVWLTVSTGHRVVVRFL